MAQRREGINVAGERAGRATGASRPLESILLVEVPCSPVSGYIILIFPKSKLID